jgi:hypothetical protein
LQQKKASRYIFGKFMSNIFILKNRNQFEFQFFNTYFFHKTD